MDLRMFYQKIKRMEESIEREHVVMVSNETSDGGKAGVLTAVSRAIAAKLIVEGRARLATDEETSAFENAQAKARTMADELANAGRLQVALISESEFRAMKSPRPLKS